MKRDDLYGKSHTGLTITAGAARNERWPLTGQFFWRKRSIRREMARLPNTEELNHGAVPFAP
jgi:hypothetical protein